MSWLQAGGPVPPSRPWRLGQVPRREGVTRHSQEASLPQGARHVFLVRRGWGQDGRVASCSRWRGPYSVSAGDGAGGSRPGPALAHTLLWCLLPAPFSLCPGCCCTWSPVFFFSLTPCAPHETHLCPRVFLLSQPFCLKQDLQSGDYGSSRASHPLGGMPWAP